jgi:hypothetical protein
MSAELNGSVGFKEQFKLIIDMSKRASCSSIT